MVQANTLFNFNQAGYGNATMKSMLIKFLLTINVFHFRLGYSFPQVQISDGVLYGSTHTTRNGKTISSFLSIPYAQPPVGNLRFNNPIPCEPWTGIRMADTDADQCPQHDGMSVVGKEDCLYLNVYTPNQNLASTQDLLPVMVWIHGGAFNSGNSSSTGYGPDYLLDKDVIFVSLNYRLGILGFLSTGDLEAPGNFGLKDQVLALKWVQKNIRAFGGNPERVTIFGQSSGAISVGLHLLSDASNGLFHQSIIQSGSVLVPWGYQNRSQYESHIKDLAFIHLCPNFSSKLIVDCLRTKSIYELLDFRSIIVENTKRIDLPFITGNVGNEAEIMTEALHSTQFLYNFVEASVTHLMDYFIGYYLKPHNVTQLREAMINYYFEGLGINNIHSEKMGETVEEAYDNSSYILGSILKFFSTHSLNFRTLTELFQEIKDQNLKVEKRASAHKAKFIDGLTRLVNDVFFFYPQVKFLENRAKMAKSPFYFYIFDYQGEVVSVQNNGIMNFTGHNEDLFYLFPLKFERMKAIGADEYVVDVILDMWTSFAKNGTPTSNYLRYPKLWTTYLENKIYLSIEDIKLRAYLNSGRERWKKQQSPLTAFLELSFATQQISSQTAF
ncbi:esterase E4-like [Belonocnema kinseyi]|uniref:esterase E4-like n=1 Tax=Belonocnema kinseyi TaxID=2817044 RepID=UPI00143D3F50|nr:esterase E4-like [Belonocnema kinseyi]